MTEGAGSDAGAAVEPAVSGRTRDTGVGRSDRPRYTWLHALNGVLLVAMWAFTIIGYNALPEQVPVHVGVDGVTRWADRDSGVWILLPVMATFHVLLMYALSGLADGSPQGINVPQKKRILALPREGQRYALEPTRPFMFGMATWLICLTMVMHWEILALAQAGPNAGRHLPVAGTLLFSLLPLPGVYWLNRVIRRRIHEWETAHD